MREKSKRKEMRRNESKEEKYERNQKPLIDENI